jgi:hypothetical protein
MTENHIVSNGAAQGDLLIVRCNGIPKNATPVEHEEGRLILARGESTGHHHSFAVGPQIALFRDNGAGSNAPLYFTASVPVSLEHQEHSTINFAPGTYKVLRQRTMRSGLARRVED